MANHVSSYPLIEDANAPWPNVTLRFEKEYANTKWIYNSLYQRFGLPPRFLDDQKTVILLPQLSKNKQPTYVTSYRGRLFLAVADLKGRRILLYRSAYGTSGKIEGAWLPSGGLASHCVGEKKDVFIGAWVVKGALGDAYLGSTDMKALCDRVNALMPKTQTDMDVWVRNVLGTSFDDAGFDLQIEIEPSVRFCTLPGKPDADQETIMRHCMDNWKNAMRAIWTT